MGWPLQRLTWILQGQMDWGRRRSCVPGKKYRMDFSADAGEGRKGKLHKGKRLEKKEFSYRCEERSDGNLTLQFAQDRGDERGVGRRGRAIAKGENVFEADARVVAAGDGEIDHGPGGLVEAVEQARKFWLAVIQRGFDGSNVLERGFQVRLAGLEQKTQATRGETGGEEFFGAGRRRETRFDTNAKREEQLCELDSAFFFEIYRGVVGENFPSGDGGVARGSVAEDPPTGADA